MRKVLGRMLGRSTMLVLCLGVASAIGCGSGSDRRVAVSGNVTFDDQPVSNGQIVFSPQSGGHSGFGIIVDGAYRIESDKGPSPGPSTVRITADRPTGQKVRPSAYSSDQTPQEVYEQFIPAKYNDSTELVVEIENTSSMTHDFDLKSE